MPGRFEALDDGLGNRMESEAVRATVLFSGTTRNPPEIHSVCGRPGNRDRSRSVLPFEICEGGCLKTGTFWALANDVAKRLQFGEKVLIHCAGGVGRTAMLAISVLLVLGEPMNQAESAVSRAGSLSGDNAADRNAFLDAPQRMNGQG